MSRRMPAEWEPHEATWVAWPHQKADWPGKFDPIPWVWCEIIRHLSRGERTRVVVPPGKADKVRDQLSRAGADLSMIDLISSATDRVWLRDSGAATVLDPGLGRLLVNWRFNGWAKYANCRKDARMGEVMATFTGLNMEKPRWMGKRIVLEGGAIDVDGAGTLLTTEECLLSTVQQRNPGMERADYEGELASHLGAAKVLWLGRGIAGDDTHGHVDDLARFVRPGCVACVHENDPADENYRPLMENLDRLAGMTDARGRRIEVVRLPMPRPVIFDSQRLPASYANFYVANHAVLVPTFNDPADRVALGILSELFPNREVVGIHAVDLVWGLGTIHCLTQQEAAIH
ncbi:MAG: agmatine deiminase family protein [Planctomycetes bacterium]|nr:agmatine deiminase family protein [Planctomycetota bacterium]